MDDLTNMYISKAEYNDYIKIYDTEIIQNEQLMQELKKNIFEDTYINQDNKWTEKFISNNGLESLNKITVDELINEIKISDKGNINIKFKYENEYLNALDFIKKTKLCYY
ncbi:MAG: hypothetical protein ACK5LZ_01015 [Anaerorhabdus sp.]